MPVPDTQDSDAVVRHIIDDQVRAIGIHSDSRIDFVAKTRRAREIGKKPDGLPETRKIGFALRDTEKVDPAVIDALKVERRPPRKPIASQRRPPAT